MPFIGSKLIQPATRQATNPKMKMMKNRRIGFIEGSLLTRHWGLRIFARRDLRRPL